VEFQAMISAAIKTVAMLSVTKFLVRELSRTRVTIGTTKATPPVQMTKSFGEGALPNVRFLTALFK
jgi:hypothetical protein